ncbi:MAG: hypothetical protein JXA25_11715 [Anaerolineales bacterium]|nr:hypothetical protein [Anaerolineales bacterium]
MRILMVIILFLHGMVHLLYAGHSKRIFEMVPGLAWPEGSWLLNRLPSETVRLLAVILLITADSLFTISGAGLLLQTNWWRIALVSAAVFSSSVFAVLWDGKMDNLPGKGAVGIVINLGLILFSVLWGWIGLLSG